MLFEHGTDTLNFIFLCYLGGASGLGPIRGNMFSLILIVNKIIKCEADL